MLLELTSWPETVGPFDTQDKLLIGSHSCRKQTTGPGPWLKRRERKVPSFSKIKVHELNLGPWKDMELADPPRKSRPPNVPLN